MVSDVNKLLEGVCTVAFQFEDDSVITSRTTLNPKILEDMGLSDIDGLVDLDVRRPIPGYLFEYYVGLQEGDSVKLNPLQELLNIGGKVSW